MGIPTPLRARWFYSWSWPELPRTEASVSAAVSSGPNMTLLEWKTFFFFLIFGVRKTQSLNLLDRLGISGTFDLANYSQNKVNGLRVLKESGPCGNLHFLSRRGECDAAFTHGQLPSPGLNSARHDSPPQGHHEPAVNGSE